MKTKEELNALKEEVETLNKKLAELSEDELKLVTGGTGMFDVPDADRDQQYEYRIYENPTERDFRPKFDNPEI